jgi:hypothetical protein
LRTDVADPLLGVDAYAEFSRQSDNDRDTGNSWIEWSIGVTGALVAGAFVASAAYPDRDWAPWAATGLAVTLLVAFFERAAVSHRSCRQKAIIAEHLSPLISNPERARVSGDYLDHVRRISRDVLVRGLLPESRWSVYWEVGTMGLLYVGAASFLSFVVFSAGLLDSIGGWACTPPTAAFVLGWVAVGGVVLFHGIRVGRAAPESWKTRLSSDPACPVCTVQNVASPGTRTTSNSGSDP